MAKAQKSTLEPENKSTSPSPMLHRREIRNHARDVFHLVEAIQERVQVPVSEIEQAVVVEIDHRLTQLAIGRSPEAQVQHREYAAFALALEDALEQKGGGCLASWWTDQASAYDRRAAQLAQQKPTAVTREHLHVLNHLHRIATGMTSLYAYASPAN